SKNIDRNIGTQSFETLVTEGLLIKVYFIITNTRRPIECFAKVLPSNQTERDTSAQKLRIYNIQLNEYVDISRSIEIQPPSKLNIIGKEFFSKVPYSAIYDPSTYSSQSVTDISRTQISPSNNNTSVRSAIEIQRSYMNRNNKLRSSTQHVSSFFF
ncbi:unnamed protein product, partial [Rotaria sordida]